MQKLLLAALLSIAALPSISRADAFDDRAALAASREVQKSVNLYWAGVYASNVKSIRAIRQFGASHSGLAADPDCAVIPAKCDGYFCHGYGDSQKGYPRIAFSSADPRSDYYFESCKISLRNGLVCSASLITFNGNALEATCYDAVGNEKNYKIAAPKAKR